MITSLYIFATGSYVVADEWNANFTAINNSNISCAAAILDANDTICFTYSDLTDVYSIMLADGNSSQISGTSVVISPQNEYYKKLSDGDDLAITIPDGLESDARILLKIGDDRDLIPFTVSYAGINENEDNLFINYDDAEFFEAGTYLILINEINNNAFVKLIWTGDE